MEVLQPLSNFFEAIRKDPRISITHIGIYAALLQCWKENEYINPIEVFSYDIMRIAKISASATYHKCIRSLHEFGYIKYEPSFKKNRGSRIYLFSDGC